MAGGLSLVVAKFGVGGGGGGGYSEPGLLCWSEPRLQTFGAGFTPISPAVIYTRRLLVAAEDLLLLQQIDIGGGTPGLIAPANIVSQGAYGDLFENVIWWDHGPNGIAPILQQGPPLHTKMVIFNNDTSLFLDGMTLEIEIGGPP